MQASFNDIANAIAQENVTVSAATCWSTTTAVPCRWLGISKPWKTSKCHHQKREGRLYLRDVATVRFVEQEKTSYAREYLQPVVSLDIIKRAGENLIAASDGINRIIAEAEASTSLPTSTSASPTTNPTKPDAGRGAANSIIFGVLLVVGVLFFLGLRNALFVGVAIPLSMFMSFMILSAPSM